jgi:hypothetical protein
MPRLKMSGYVNGEELTKLSLKPLEPVPNANAADEITHVSPCPSATFLARRRMETSRDFSLPVDCLSDELIVRKILLSKAIGH